MYQLSASPNKAHVVGPLVHLIKTGIAIASLCIHTHQQLLVLFFSSLFSQALDSFESRFHIEKQQQYVNDTDDDAVSADINLLYPHNMWYHFPLAGIP